MFVRKQVKQKSDDVAKAYNAALRYLTRREYSKVELYNKLKLYYTDSASKEAPSAFPFQDGDGSR